MKRFSVIIPNYNSPILDLTLDSLLSQSYPKDRFEIIVVGMDKYHLVKTSEFVREIKSVSKLSPAQARNLGAVYSDAEILVFIDADCLAAPDWLEILDRTFSSTMSIKRDAIGGSVRFETTNYWTLANNISMFYEFLETSETGERDYLPSLNLAIPREIFLSVGGFDERYPRPSGEDFDLCSRLRKAGYKIIFQPSAIVEHRPDRNSIFDLLAHGYYQGKYSVKVDRRYREISDIPKLINNRAGLILASPILSIFAAFRCLYKAKNYKYWFTFPGILLNKIAWCIGAASYPNLNDLPKASKSNGTRSIQPKTDHE